MKQKYKQQSRKVSFKGFDGSGLSASLDFPEGIVPEEYIIISHCFTCTKQTLTTARLSRGLVQAGFAVLRFDFTGLGDSDGCFANTHFTSMSQDIESAASWLAEHYEPAGILIGHSMGGTASLLASQSKHVSLSAINKIVTLASPSEPAHVLHHFGAAMDLLQRGERAQIKVAGHAYDVRPAFIADVQAYYMPEVMQACDIPVMAVRAGKDELVRPEDADQIVEYAGAGSEVCQIDGADHLFSERDHAASLLCDVLSWLS